MKSSSFLHLLAVILALCLAQGRIQAQYVSYPESKQENAHLFYPNMDTDIFLLRANAFPEIRCYWDDYLRFSPGLVMLGLKASGYEGRNSWAGMALSDFLSLGIMTVGVKGLKYVVKRERPDASSMDSFPSGHSALAFSLATMMHLEYGWRSPWFSIGSYSIASSTALMRIVNNRHWMSDTMVGALIGIGATHLGYYLGDCLLGGKQIQPGYAHPEFFYDVHRKEWQVDLIFGRRFILGSSSLKSQGLLPERGSGISLNACLPLAFLHAGEQVGLMLRGGMGSLVNHNVYEALTGVYVLFPLNDRFRFQTHLMAGYAYLTAGRSNHLAALTGLTLTYALGRHFQLKGWTEYELIGRSRQMHTLNSILTGFSVGFCW